MTHNHNPLPEHELLTHKSFLKSLNTVDCLFALLTAAGAFFAQTRIQHTMDIYEMVILWASAGITVFLGWFFKPMRWFAPLCAVLAYGAVMLYDGEITHSDSFLLKYFLSSQSAIMWQCAFVFFALFAYITGAVLATMLDQRSTDVGDDEQAAYAYPSTLEGRILDGAAAPVVQSVQIRSTPYAGEGQRPGAGGSYTPATGSYTYTTFNGTKVSDGTNPHFEVNSIGMDLEVTNTEHAVTLATHLVALDENGGNYLEGPTYTGAGASIGKSDSIHFGSVVAEWKNGAHNVQLLVNRVADDQAALCWNYHLPDTNRLYCNKWTVPHGWKEGQPLVKAGHYLVEVRDGNTTYWHTRKLGQ